MLFNDLILIFISAFFLMAGNMDWTITEYVNRKGATTLSGLVVSVARIQVEQLPSPLKNVCSTVLIPNANTILAQRTL